MDREEMKQVVLGIVNDITGASFPQIKEEDNLIENLKLDSINLVNLQVLLEDEFEIRFNPIEDNMTEVFETVHNLVDCIEKKLK